VRFLECVLDRGSLALPNNCIRHRRFNSRSSALEQLHLLDQQTFELLTLNSTFHCNVAHALPHICKRMTRMRARSNNEACTHSSQCWRVRSRIALVVPASCAHLEVGAPRGRTRWVRQIAANPVCRRPCRDSAVAISTSQNHCRGSAFTRVNFIFSLCLHCFRCAFLHILVTREVTIASLRER
jgi:hypothetical protein